MTGIVDRQTLSSGPRPQDKTGEMNMTQWDLSILDWIQKQFQCAVLDRVMPCITLLGEAWAVILVALVLLAVPRTRKLGLAVALALALDGLVCNGILKPLVARPRPYTLREVSLLIAAPRDYSFPSGHSAAAFAVATALCREKSRGGIPALVLAGVIALSRLYLYVHYPSDVICGTILGMICGIFGSILAEKVAEIYKKRQN